MGPKQLCQLAEMVSVTPLEVLTLVLEATTQQLCLFFDLVEQSKRPAERVSPPDPPRDRTPAKSGKSLFDQLRELGEQRCGWSSTFCRDGQQTE